MKCRRACTSSLSRLESDLLPTYLHLLPSTSILQLQNESLHGVHKRKFNMWLWSWCLENEEWSGVLDGGDRDNRSCFSTYNTQPVSRERGKSWNHHKSNFGRFEQRVGLMKELWRATSTSLKEGHYGLYYPCPSSFVWSLCLVLSNEGSQYLFGFFFLLFFFFLI